jgi:YVTN family beta-propeller protein
MISVKHALLVTALLALFLPVSLSLTAGSVFSSARVSAVTPSSFLTSSKLPKEVYVADFGYNYGPNHDHVEQGNVSVINGSTNKVIDTIAVGDEPYGGAYDPQNKEIYIVDYLYLANSVTVINSATNKVIKTISSGSRPIGAAYDSHNHDVYVANFGDSTVSVIDTSINKVVATIDVGPSGGPTAIVFNPHNDELYATSGLDASSVFVISDSNNSVIKTIDDPGDFPYPLAEALNPANDELYVANFGNNDVVVINCTTNTVLTTVFVGDSPDGVGFDASNKDMYVSNYLGASVSVINIKNSVVATINVGTGPSGLGYDSQNNEMYVTNWASGTVSAINSKTNKVVDTIKVGAGPIGIVVS